MFSADLKPIYKAATEELALAALDELEAKWGGKYALGVKSRTQLRLLQPLKPDVSLYG